jgi:hypothetical protein
MDYRTAITKHCNEIWGDNLQIKYFGKGPIEELPKNFCVLEYKPRHEDNMWKYTTCCMSQETDENPIELHMFSPKQSSEVIELLTVIAHSHRRHEKYDLHHTLNFGKSWIDNSLCTRGYISLPYLYGPKLEDMEFQNKITKFYWLIPITDSELEYAKKYGVEAIERKFDTPGFNYLDINRKSLL